MDEDLHREIIEEHARHPRNKLELPNADLTGEYRSEKTGNESKVFLKLAADGKVAKASFLGQGSALSLASGSLLASHASGSSLQDLARLVEKIENVVYILILNQFFLKMWLQMRKCGRKQIAKETQRAGP